MNEKYAFVDVPAVGYALNIHPLAFGFVGHETNPPVTIFIRNQNKKKELEQIITQETNKTFFHTLIHGIGDNSRFYSPGTALGLVAASTPFFCPLHVALIGLVGIPFFIVPRYLQKKSINKMVNWLQSASIKQFEVQSLTDYATKEGLEKKIGAYVTRKSELGFFASMGAFFSEPKDIAKMRIELAKDYKELHWLSAQMLNQAPQDHIYPLTVIQDVYRFVHNAYDGKWFPRQKQVIFTAPISSCQHGCHESDK